MTPQERQLLESLAGRIANTPPPQKDPEADQLIQERIGSRPDALYILAQTVLIQEMALNQANGRLHDLQEQINAQQGQQNQPHTSFLGRLFGAQYAPPQQYAQSQYAAPPPPPPQYAPPYQPQYAPQYPPQYQQGAPSFLRSAATTATGVAAGALAFEGIESLMHGFGGGGGGFGGGYGGGGNETIVNNYYDEPRDGGGSEHQSAGFLDDSSADNSNADYSDDSSSDSSSDDSSSGDDSSS